MIEIGGFFVVIFILRKKFFSGRYEVRRGLLVRVRDFLWFDERIVDVWKDRLVCNRGLRILFKKRFKF